MRSLLKDINRYFGSKSLKRKALTKPNIVYLRWRYVSNRERTLKAWLHRPVYAGSPALAEELKRRGIAVGPSSLFLDQQGQEALAEASALVLDLSRGDDVQARMRGSTGDRKDYVLHLVPYDQEHTADSPLLRLALNRKLLEIVSLYLGMWPRLNLISAWLNYPTKDAPKELQLWHRDPEDLKIIKVFIYLNDVDEKGGPFCYIPTTHPFGSGAARVPTQIDPNRVSDDEMRATIPEEFLARLHRSREHDDPRRHHRLPSGRQTESWQSDIDNLHLHVGSSNNKAHPKHPERRELDHACDAALRAGEIGEGWLLVA